MAKKEWLGWFKCNVLEIIILILVLVLLVKVFSVSAVTEVSTVPMIEEPAVLEEAPVAGVPLETSAAEVPAIAEVLSQSNETAPLPPLK